MLVEAMLNWLSKSSNLLVSLLGIVVAIDGSARFIRTILKVGTLVIRDHIAD